MSLGALSKLVFSSRRTPARTHHTGTQPSSKDVECTVLCTRHKQPPPHAAVPSPDIHPCRPPPPRRRARAHSLTTTTVQHQRSLHAQIGPHHLSQGTSALGWSNPSCPRRRMARLHACGIRSSPQARRQSLRRQPGRRCSRICSSSRTGRQSAMCSQRHRRGTRKRRTRRSGGRCRAARGAHRGCG